MILNPINPTRGLTTSIVGNTLTVTIDNSDGSLTAQDINIGETEVGDTTDISSLNTYNGGQAFIALVGECVTSSVCSGVTIGYSNSNTVNNLDTCSPTTYSIVNTVGCTATINSTTGIITFNSFSDCDFSVEYEACCNGFCDTAFVIGTPRMLEFDLNETLDTTVGQTKIFDVSTLLQFIDTSACGSVANLTYVITSQFTWPAPASNTTVASVSLSGSNLSYTGVTQGINGAQDYYVVNVRVCCDNCPTECENIQFRIFVF